LRLRERRLHVSHVSIVRRKADRIRVVVAALGLAVGGLAVVPASSQPVVAQQDACTPSGSTAPVDEWKTEFTGRGVTLCLGNEHVIGSPDAALQIVDLSAGAKVHLVSDACLDPDTCGYSDVARQTDLPYRKRTVSEWADWIIDNVHEPEFGSELFSTTNASFFRDTGFTEPMSPIFLAQKTTDYVPNGAPFRQNSTWGLASAPKHHIRPWWNSRKVALSLGDVHIPHQKAEMFDFPRHYKDDDIGDLFFGQEADSERINGDQIVGRAPNVGEKTARRTYVGIDQSGGERDRRIFILNANIGYTLDQAETTLESFGSTFEVQLDGGASTQLWADVNGGETVIPDGIPFIDREVPDTVAVYLAP